MISPRYSLSYPLSFCLLALLLLTAVRSGPAMAGFYAAQLTPANIGRLPASGMDGIGGLDDWLVTDGVLCAVVSGKTHASYLSLTGGVLVDLWHCDAANDQWNSAHPQFNLQKDEIPDTREIVAGFDEGSAFVETRAEREGLEATIRYSLSRANRASWMWKRASRVLRPVRPWACLARSCFTRVAL